MCESNGERRVCASPDENELSRRTFLKGMVAGCVSTVTGMVVGGIAQGAIEGRPVTPIQHDERGITLPDASSLVVVDLSPEGVERHQGTEQIREQVVRALGRIAITTDYAVYPNVQFVRDGSTPDVVLATENGEESVYSSKMIWRIGESYAKKTASSMTLVIVNGFDAENQQVGGLAYAAGNPPTALVRGKMLTSGVTVHEIGHLLKLGHAWEMESWASRVKDRASALKDSLQHSTIQEIIQAGYGLVKDANGNPDPYASGYSAMGDASLVDKTGMHVPVFSSADLLRLDPTRSLYHVGDPAERTGKIPIRYERGQILGITMDIPSDHALRDVIPDIDTIFIGPLVYSLEKYRHNPIERMGVFATWDGGSKSALLNPSAWDERIQYDKRGFEHVIYSDEQLGTLVVAGHENHEVYVRVVPLHTEEAQRLRQVEAQKLAEKEASEEASADEDSPSFTVGS